MRRKFDVQGYRERIPVDFIFILALLCVFAFGSLVSVIFASNNYKEIHEEMDTNFEFRTTLSYIASKVRQGDDLDSVRIAEKDGASALVLATIDNGEPCETWIYEYDGHLYEVYISEQTPFELQDGTEMIPSYGLAFEADDNLLHITANDAQGSARTLTLCLRTDQGGALQ